MEQITNEQLALAHEVCAEESESGTVTLYDVIHETLGDIDLPNEDIDNFMTLLLDGERVDGSTEITKDQLDSFQIIPQFAGGR